MILKKEIKKNKIFFNINKFLFFYFISTIIAAIILIIAILQSQTFKQTQSKYLDLLSKGGRFEYLYLPNIIFKVIKSNFYEIKKIDLEIKFNESLILENVRKESIERGSLPETISNPRVNFNLVDKDNKYSGEIRLKGDRKVHFVEKEKSSYKVKLDKDQYYLGLRKFSLQKPRIRNYIHEWIFHEMAGDLDLIRIKYEFLNLSINGEQKGLYVLEEGFGKELVERNKRRNSPIFGLNEDLYEETDDPVFEIYNKKYWSKDENKDLARVASQKLRDFFNDDIALDQVFDIERWAKYFAIVDMTSNYHGAFLKSVKLYYNPLNGLFEPIPFDGHRLKPNYHKYNLNYDDRILIDIVNNPINRDEELGFSWLKKFFYKGDENLNSEFYNLYLKNLNFISSKPFLDKFINKNLNKIKEINSHIYSDYFYYDNSRNYGIGLYYFLLSDFFHHSENIQNKLKIRKKIQVLKNNDTELLVKNYYKNYGPLVANRLICTKYNQNVDIEISTLLNNFSNTIIKIPVEKIKNLDCTHVNFFEEFSKKSFSLKIDNINSKYSYKSQKNLNQNILKKYFFKKDNHLFLLRDEVKISQNIYIPKGLKVIVKPGQKILLTNKAFIISNSPWVIGGKGKKTIITGEKNNLGGGIFIGDNNELSKIENTMFSYLNGYNLELNSEFLILGSINFHQTRVEIAKVDFENIFSEDAINIFRSEFKIDNSNYLNISSDAIDIDFSKGEIKSVSFKNIANDAMDFSGSNVNISDSYFENVNDKLISGGEKSNIKISKVNAINSKSGIISKDGSKVYSNDISFKGVQIPFAAYQKKKEYNHGLLIVKDFTLDNFLVKFVKDDKSKIVLDDLMQNNDNNNKKMLSVVNQ